MGDQLLSNLSTLISSERVVEVTRALCAVRASDGTEAEMAKVIASLLDRPGVELTLDDVLEGRPNLIARVRGSDSGPGLLLNGHIDRAFVGHGWSRDPHQAWVEDGRIYGAAVTDMLGAVAAMVAATEAATQVELPGDLVLLASMYHDTVGLGVKYAMAAQDGWPTYGICGEPSMLRIHDANGGTIKFGVEFEGRTAHISRLEEGADALAAAVDFAREARTAALEHERCERLPGLPRLLVGQLRAGEGPGIVAESATVAGDIRTVPGMSRADVGRQLQELADRALPAGVTARVRIGAVQRPFLGPRSGTLVEALGRAHERICGAPIELVPPGEPEQAYVIDAVDMQAAGIETVGYGPGDWHYAPDESVELAELVDAARVYLATALLLLGESRA